MSSTQVLATRRFQAADQEQFARLSGDRNPIHMDQVAARRTQAGAPVVHGMHALLWGLDILSEREPLARQVVTLSCNFTKFMHVGEAVSLSLVSHTDAQIRARLTVDDTTVARFAFGRGTPKSSALSDFSKRAMTEGSSAIDSPASPTLQQMRRLRGQLDVISSSNETARQFPLAASAIAPQRVAALARLSCLVGMVCPGRDSIFSSLQLDFVDENLDQSVISFHVTDVDERFRVVRMSILGAGLSGSLEAFAPKPPVRQTSVSTIAEHVSPTEFAGCRVLIVGGSRGLGELTAKILAVGGAQVVITYVTGRHDAEEVAREINDRGGACQVLEYNVLRPPGDQLSELKHVPSHLYYFATPRIAARKRATFTPQRFEEFNRYYVHGFHALCVALKARSTERLSVFYPSPIFVDRRPFDMTEYLMAKAAAAVLCDELNRSNLGLRITHQRLPQLLTDQTNGIIGAELPSSLAAMLPALRQFHASVQSPESQRR